MLSPHPNSRTRRLTLVCLGPVGMPRGTGSGGENRTPDLGIMRPSLYH